MLKRSPAGVTGFLLPFPGLLEDRGVAPATTEFEALPPAEFWYWFKSRRREKKRKLYFLHKRTLVIFPSLTCVQLNQMGLFERQSTNDSQHSD